MSKKSRNSPADRLSLDEIGLKHRTDKASSHHDYLESYERILAGIRDEPIEVLEIGVQTGASIRMWHEYFPHASIVGVDIDDVGPMPELDRYTFRKGSQDDFVFLTGLVQIHDFALVIDDGSHYWGHQIFSFQTILPWLRPGSIFICEDIHTSFGPVYPDYYRGGARESAGDYFARLALDIAAGSQRLPQTLADPLYEGILARVRSVTFIRQSVIIEV